MEETVKNGGFSIIEVAIATGIVAMTFAATMSLFAYNLRVEILNRNKITASYLAQEAIEIIKQKRDTNWFTSKNSSDWLSGITTDRTVALSIKDENNIPGGWTISSSLTNAKKIYLYDGSYLQSVSAHGSDDRWIDTGFERTMVIDSSTNDRIKITVTVKYNSGKNSAVITSYLYNDWLK